MLALRLHCAVQEKRGKDSGNKSCQVDVTMTLQDMQSDAREQYLIEVLHNMAKLDIATIGYYRHGTVLTSITL